MSYIRTSCPQCLQTVALSPADVALQPITYSDAPRYAFQCPGCDRRVVKPADEQTYAVLVAAGAVTSQPPAPQHPERPPAGPPLTYDDALDFHQLLSRPDWFTQLVTTA